MNLSQDHKSTKDEPAAGQTSHLSSQKLSEQKLRDEQVRQKRSDEAIRGSRKANADSLDGDEATLGNP